MDYSKLLKNGQLNQAAWKKFKTEDNLSILISDCKVKNCFSDIERLYCVIHNIEKKPGCVVCGKETKFHIFKYGYSKSCGGKCAANIPEAKEKRKETWVSLYGKGTSGAELKKEKTKKTSIEKYGVDSPNKVKSIHNKANQTKLEKYGPDYNRICAELSRKSLNENFGVNSLAEYNKKFPQVTKSHRNHCPENFALLDDKEWLKDQYSRNTICQIGDSLGIAHSTINNYLIKHDIVRDNWTWKSQVQSDIENYVKSIFPGVVKSQDRSILSGRKEIDILVPEMKLGIEVNGIYWHSSQSNENKNYHLTKTEEAESMGYKLLHILDTEWKDKNQIWKSIIKHNLGVSDTKIYARKCSVNEIKSVTANEFYERNHLQGKCSGGKSLGLFYQNNLVACLTIGKSRFEVDTFELIRFASCINTVVVGGFSKLLSRVGVPLVSYANRRWSTGNVYKVNSFKFESNTTPNYNYVKGNKIFSRYQMQKHKLSSILENFDPLKTEFENVIANGYRILYDSGNMKFRYTPSVAKPTENTNLLIV